MTQVLLGLDDHYKVGAHDKTVREMLKSNPGHLIFVRHIRWRMNPEDRLAGFKEEVHVQLDLLCEERPPGLFLRFSDVDDTQPEPPRIGEIDGWGLW